MVLCTNSFFLCIEISEPGREDSLNFAGDGSREAVAVKQLNLEEFADSSMEDLRREVRGDMLLSIVGRNFEMSTDGIMHLKHSSTM